MSDLYRINPDRTDRRSNFVAERFTVRDRFGAEVGVLVKVEPCKHGNYAEHVVRWDSIEPPHIFNWCDGTPDEVNYPTGAVLRSAELAAEDADPELHHHEVTHSHPFTNLGHTHDQPIIEVSDV